MNLLTMERHTLYIQNYLYQIIEYFHGITVLIVNLIKKNIPLA